MPKGPKGEKRPADLIGMSVMVARIATGEIEDTSLRQPAKRISGLAGSKVRQKNTTEARREEIARKAASARWK